MKKSIRSLFALIGLLLSFSIYAVPPECKEPGAPPECFNKSLADVKEEISNSSIRGETTPKYIQEYLIKQLNSDNSAVLNMIEKSSNPKVCCAYDCGYNGCRYKTIRKQACNTVGGSAVSSSKCK